MGSTSTSSIPVLDLHWADLPAKRPLLLQQLRDALFDVGFLYIINHNVPSATISGLTDRLPGLFALPEHERAALSKLNSPHFLGYSGFAEEETLGRRDLREQFDFATELPVVYRKTTNRGVTNVEVNTAERNGHAEDKTSDRDYTQLYWRLRGPNQWPSEKSLPGFREAFTAYHDALQELSYRFVHLIEAAFDIPLGTFDHFFGMAEGNADGRTALHASAGPHCSFLPPQHRIKLLKYPPSDLSASAEASSSQGVGAHKDSSGWLTFLNQVGNEPGLEVQLSDGTWAAAPPIPGTFVVNFGNALEAATCGAVRATVHRVIAPRYDAAIRYSIPFFQGLPLDMTVSEVRQYIPERVKRLRQEIQGGGSVADGVSSFLDPRWDSLGESQLRKWMRSHCDVAVKWYGSEAIAYYTG